jgi:TRAP-type C4-dicarboxylate transport system permease small subunit
LAEILRKIDRAVHKILLVIAQVSLIAMVLILTYTVILRYVFNTGLSWAEEVPRLLVTVFVFLACAMGVRDHLHISVNVVYNRFKKDGRMRKRWRCLATSQCLPAGCSCLSSADSGY